MRPEQAWGARWVNCAHPLAHEYMRIACKKRSLVVLAADLPSIGEIVEIISKLGSRICVLKTHVDMVEDFTPAGWSDVVDAARGEDVLLFEDRKFADIGRVAQTQMGGHYNIASWADIVTSHSVSGPDVVDGIAAAWEGIERVGGVLLLAQMSSLENLLDNNYSHRTIGMGSASPHVIGYIGNGSSPDSLASLREIVGEGKMIWTPGINIDVEKGVLGQRYGHPTDAVRAGSDAVIVGSGIHGAEDPLAAATEYAEASWISLLER